MNKAQDSGFNNVFRYISGHNEGKSKISMTTPVVTYEENQRLITGFYVPSKYNKSTIPKPLEKDVFINELSRSYYAVIRFSGQWKASNFDKHDKLLKEHMSKNGYIPTSPRLILRYQPPFVPSFFRRNEIAYKIQDV